MTRPQGRSEWLVDLPSGLAVCAAWGEVEFRRLPDGSFLIDAIRPADASVDLVELIRHALTAIAAHLDPCRSVH